MAVVAKFRRHLVLAIVATLQAHVCAWDHLPGSHWLESEAPWEPHTGSVAVPLQNGSVILTGGQAGEHGHGDLHCYNCTNEVWSFDPVAESWTNLSDDVPWEPRWGHSAVVTKDDTVWLMFGCCAPGQQGVLFNDVWAFNPTYEHTWHKVPTTPPFEGIQASSVVIRHNELWVVGGWSTERGTLSQVTVLALADLHWTVKSDHGNVPWKSRADHASAISPDGNWLFVYGGQHLDENTQNWFRLKDTWRVQLPAARPKAWKEIGPLPSARSSSPVLTTPSGWLLALGGHSVPDDEHLTGGQESSGDMIDHHRAGNFTAFNDIVGMDMTNGGKDGWKVLEEKAPWPARDDCAAVIIKSGALIMFGGGTTYNGSGHLKDVWMLTNAAATLNLPVKPVMHHGHDSDEL